MKSNFEVSSGNYQPITNDYVQFHVNLKKLPKTCYNELTEIEKYYTLLTLEEEKELKELSEGDVILMDAVNKLKIMSNDSVLITELEHDQVDEYCKMLAREEILDKGKKIEKIEIAKKMLEKNIDISLISDCTGLSIEEISKLNGETTL